MDLCKMVVHMLVNLKMGSGMEKGIQQIQKIISAMLNFIKVELLDSDE